MRESLPRCREGENVHENNFLCSQQKLCRKRECLPLLDPVGPGVGALSFCSSLLATMRQVSLRTQSYPEGTESPDCTVSAVAILFAFLLHVLIRFLIISN